LGSLRWREGGNWGTILRPADLVAPGIGLLEPVRRWKRGELPHTSGLRSSPQRPAQSVPALAASCMLFLSRASLSLTSNLWPL